MPCPTGPDCRLSWVFPRPTPTTVKPSNPWSRPYRRCGRGAAHGGLGQASCTRTRPTTSLSCADGCASCQRRITPRIARKGIESTEKLGRHRWVIERSIAWLFGYRRLTVRYERHANLFCAFLTLAATLTCYKKLAKAK